MQLRALPHPYLLAATDPSGSTRHHSASAICSVTHCSTVLATRLQMEEAEEEEVYTRPLPLTSCQEDRLGLDYTVLCHDYFFSLSPTVLLGVFRENLLGLPLWRYATRVSDPWLSQEMWFRPLLGGGMR